MVMAMMLSPIVVLAQASTNATPVTGANTTALPSATVVGGSSAADTSKGLGSALGNLKSATLGSGLEADFSVTVSGVVKTALSLVGTIFLVLMVYSGILWMTASGKEEQVEKAGKIIKTSIIGLFVVMSAYAITYFITTNLGAGTSSSSSTSGSTSGYVTPTQCAKLGGSCNKFNEVTNEACPTGGTDKFGFTGTNFGLCSKIEACCEATEEAGSGKYRCETLMQGKCVGGTSGCPTGMTQSGECEAGTWDDYCCIYPSI